MGAEIVGIPGDIGLGELSKSVFSSSTLWRNMSTARVPAPALLASDDLLMSECHSVPRTSFSHRASRDLTLVASEGQILLPPPLRFRRCCSRGRRALCCCLCSC